MPIEFGPLDEKDNRAAFSCENDRLNRWFHDRALDEQQARFCNVFVARDSELGIVGFYSLSTFSIYADDLPIEIRRELRKFRYDAVPCALIGRLARDKRLAGEGFGGELLADAIHHILESARTVACYAIIVDADPEARDFYLAHGFQPLHDYPRRLFLPLATAERGSIEAS